MENIFEQATRNQLRFCSEVGLLTVEDLWRLPLTSASKVSLNNVAKIASRQIKELDEEDFVSLPTDDKKMLELGLNVIKHIIKTRIDENAAKDNQKLKEQHRDEIAEILEEKRKDSLKDKSVEELEAMLK